MMTGIALGVRGARRFVPTLERLEYRDCPAAPVIASFTATQVAGQQVLLSGMVVDESPDGCTVSFTGAADGEAGVNALGQFSVTVSLNAISVIHAQALDPESLQSGVVDRTPANNVPQILDFCAEHIGGPNNVWRFSGRVVDESPVGLVVTLSGLPSIQGIQVTVDQDGWFSWTTSLDTSENGTVCADVTDWYGAAAQTAMDIVRH